MKKLLSITFLSLFSLSLLGCSQTTNTDVPDEVSNTTSEQPADSESVGINIVIGEKESEEKN